MDTIVAQGMTTVTFAEMLTQIETEEASLQTRTTDVTGYDVYTYDYDDDTAASPVPVAGSPLLGAGKKWKTGPHPVGMNGEPFPAYDIDIGTVCSLLSDHHPSNL